MQFEEKGDNIITIKNHQKTSLVFVYFLIKDNDVVYVGQTVKGLTRPFQHVDKDFDTVKLMPCNVDDKDVIEDFFIKKYSPKYNKSPNGATNYSLLRVRNKIRRELGFSNFSLSDVKKVVRILNINYVFIDAKAYLYIDDVDLIIKSFKEILKGHGD